MGEDPLIEESRIECKENLQKLRSALDFMNEARDYNLHTYYLEKN